MPYMCGYILLGGVGDTLEIREIVNDHVIAFHG